MKFAEYMAERKIDYATAAKELDISRAYVGQLANKKSTPGFKLATRIGTWSSGKVTFESWES